MTSFDDDAMTSVTPAMKLPCCESSHNSSPFSVGYSESKSQIISL